MICLHFIKKEKINHQASFIHEMASDFKTNEVYMNNCILSRQVFGVTRHCVRNMTQVAGKIIEDCLNFFFFIKT